ncbi:MAG: HepT-like ribonuclease domain-containing protein [Planctomycetota bacterium]
MGEAASKVTEDTRRMHPSLPWLDVIGMRNRLIHAYFDVDLDRVWDTLTADLPPLTTELERILAD